MVESIVAHRTWVLPYRNGDLPSKPPLFHWLAAALAHLLPISDATVRAPSAIGFWAMASAVLVLGNTAGGRAGGWLALGALFGMEPIWECASEARVDMVFAACFTIALGSFYLWYQSRRAWQRSLFFLGLALAILAKGPAAVVLAAIVIPGFLVWEGKLGLLRDLRSWSLVAGAAIAGGWYALAWHAGGQDFLAKQIMHENVNRFLGTGFFADPSRRESPFKLALTLSAQVLPWSLALLWEGYRGLRGQRQDALGRFLHTWWLAVLLFFSASAAKRNIYLLPAYPAVALLAGRGVAMLGTRRPRAGSDSRAAAPPAARAVAFAGRVGVVVAAAIVTFDLALVGGLQAVRVYRAGRDSLVAFAKEVERRLPAAAPLYAPADFSQTDLLVLSYRLGRRIEQKEVEPKEGEFFLVPQRDLASLTGAGYAVICASNRRRANVALVTAPSRSAQPAGEGMAVRGERGNEEPAGRAGLRGKP